MPTKERLIQLGKDLFKKMGEDDLSGASAELAYRFFLAIFPFFIFLAALGGFIASAANVANPTDEVMIQLGDSLPEDASSLLRTQLEGVIDQRDASLMTIGIIGALWAASSGIGTLMKELNHIYGVEEARPFWMKSGIAVGLTFLGAGLLVLSFIIFFVGQVYGQKIAEELGMGDAANLGFRLAQYVVPLLGVLFAVGLLYWLAPNTKGRARWISPGAVFFAFAWFLATAGFGFYVSNFGSYNATYGALAGIVILLFWFYLTGFLLLLGAELNVLLERGPETTEPERHTIDDHLVATDAATTPSLHDYREAASPESKAHGSAAVGLASLVWVLALVGVMRGGIRPKDD